MTCLVMLHAPRPLIPLAAGLLALAIGGCTETGIEPPPEEHDTIIVPGLVISEPRGVVADAAALASDGTAGATHLAYVSAEPGTFPRAVQIRIRNLSTADAGISVAVREGGFDPVGIAATAGDRLELLITDFSGAVQYAHADVPVRRPPVIVRTNPPKGRTDVALSVQPVVIFSEPIDPQTVDATSIRLLRDGVVVSGAVALVAGSPFEAELTPETVLEPQTEYELVVTTAVRDLDGESLPEEYRVPFTTAWKDQPQSGSEVYDLRATVTNFDPAWGDLTGYIYSAVLTFQDGTRNEPGVVGTYADFRLTSPDGVILPIDPGIITSFVDFAGRVVLELVNSNNHFTLVPEGDLDGVVIEGRFGQGGHIGGPFTAHRRNEHTVESGLAFVHDGAVFVSWLDGAAPVQLLTAAARPASSPDGTRIAFTRPAGNDLARWQLCVAWEDGTDVRCATGGRDGYVAGGPSWSPDGLTVAFNVWIYDCPNGNCEHGGYFSGLLLLNTLSMEVESVSTPSLTSFSTFGSGYFGRGQLETMNADGSGRVILAESFGSYTVREVAWSPDGSRLALSRTRGDECWFDHHPCGSDILVTGADGVGTEVIIAGGGSPSWRQ